MCPFPHYANGQNWRRLHSIPQAYQASLLTAVQVRQEAAKPKTDPLARASAREARDARPTQASRARGPACFPPSSPHFRATAEQTHLLGGGGGVPAVRSVILCVSCLRVLGSGKPHKRSRLSDFTDRNCSTCRRHSSNNKPLSRDSVPCRQLAAGLNFVGEGCCCP